MCIFSTFDLCSHPGCTANAERWMMMTDRKGESRLEESPFVASLICAAAFGRRARFGSRAGRGGGCQVSFRRPLSFIKAVLPVKAARAQPVIRHGLGRSQRRLSPA